MRTHLHVIPIALLMSCAPAGAQPTEPPTFIRLIRNWSRPSPGTRLIRPYFDARADVTVLGMTSISGMPETWLLEAHDSFGSIEELDQKINTDAWAGPAAGVRGDSDDDALGSSRNLIGLYLPNWSYRPDQAVRAMPKARYFHVTVYRVMPGTDSTFADLVRLRRQSYDAINLDRPEIAYRVISGGNGGMYIFLSPLSSLRMMDNGLAKNPAYAEAMTEGGSQSGRKLAAETVISRENLLMRVQPGFSYVSDEFAAPDMEFWRGKQ